VSMLIPAMLLAQPSERKGIWKWEASLPGLSAKPMLGLNFVGEDGNSTLSGALTAPPVPAVQAVANEIGPSFGQFVRTGDREFRPTAYAIMWKAGQVNGTQTPSELKAALLTRAFVLQRFAYCLTRRRLPHPRAVILTRGHDPFPVGTERYAIHTVVVPERFSYRLTSGRFPHPCRVILTRREARPLAPENFFLTHRHPQSAQMAAALWLALLRLLILPQYSTYWRIVLRKQFPMRKERFYGIPISAKCFALLFRF